jgi:hypothetical protein
LVNIIKNKPIVNSVTESKIPSNTGVESANMNNELKSEQENEKKTTKAKNNFGSTRPDQPLPPINIDGASRSLYRSVY